MEPKPAIQTLSLAKAPLPYYLTGDFKVSDDLLELSATARFPSTDPSVASRTDPVPHANTAHHTQAAAQLLFAGWNGANLSGQGYEVESLLALDTRIRTPQVTEPDVDCRMEAKITHLERSQKTRLIKGKSFKTRLGTYEVTFFQNQMVEEGGSHAEREVLVATIEAKFLAVF